jgi:hypothetical protein
VRKNKQNPFEAMFQAFVKDFGGEILLPEAAEGQKTAD